MRPLGSWLSVSVETGTGTTVATTRDEAILQPDRATAWRWTLVGAVAVGLALWIAVDAGTSVLAWTFVALCVVLSSYVVLQLVAPRRFQLRMDAAAIEVALPWQHHRIPWQRIHLARVVTVAGEPVLELHLWDPDDPAQGSPRPTGALLPVGADLDALHAMLDRHLGLADPDPAPGAPVSRSEPA